MSAQNARTTESEFSRVERRASEDRYVSIFRAAKLSRGGVEELCVLRNISAGGAMLAHNAGLQVGEQISLDLRLDDHLDASVVWVKDDRCGLKFAAPADLPRILAGHTGGTKPRPPRLRVSVDIALMADKTEYRGQLRDISQAGACIAVDDRTVPRLPEFRVGLRGMGDYRAIVCWRRSGFVGVNFASTLPMWPLNDWVRAQAPR